MKILTLNKKKKKINIKLLIKKNRIDSKFFVDSIILFVIKFFLLEQINILLNIIFNPKLY